MLQRPIGKHRAALQKVGEMIASADGGATFKMHAAFRSMPSGQSVGAYLAPLQITPDLGRDTGPYW